MSIAEQHTRAADPTTSPAELAVLSSARRVEVRLAVAGNPSTPLEALRRLADDKNPGVRYAVPERPHRVARLAAAQADDPVARIVVARHPDLDVEITRLLVEDADPDVRATLAGHTRSRHFLETLMNDPSEVVRAGATENPTLTDDDVVVLAADPAPPVRAAVASSARTPVTLVEQLRTDPIAMVRAAAYARLPLTDQTRANVERTIRRMAELGDIPGVTRGWARHPMPLFGSGWMFTTKVLGEVEAFTTASYLAWDSLMEHASWREWYAAHSADLKASGSRIWFEDRAELSITKVGRPPSVAVGVPAAELRESEDVVGYLRNVFADSAARLADALDLPAPPRIGRH